MSLFPSGVVARVAEARRPTEGRGRVQGAVDPQDLEGRFQRIQEGFGLRWVTHRIGQETLVVAEVREVDRCVEALYPDCLISHGDAPVWMISWPAAFGLAEWVLLRTPVRDRQVLELGCGTAVAGVAAARGGAQVLSTDYDRNALAFAQENARRNGCASLDLGVLDWYAPSLPHRFDWVIGSEVTYHEQAFDALLGLLDLALAPGGRVLLSDIYRSQSTRFLDRCSAAGYRVRTHRVVVHLPEESRPVRVAELRQG